MKSLSLATLTRLHNGCKDSSIPQRPQRQHGPTPHQPAQPPQRLFPKMQLSSELPAAPARLKISSQTRRNPHKPLPRHSASGARNEDRPLLRCAMTDSDYRAGRGRSRAITCTDRPHRAVRSIVSLPRLFSTQWHPVYAACCLPVARGSEIQELPATAANCKDTLPLGWIQEACEIDFPESGYGQ